MKITQFSVVCTSGIDFHHKHYFFQNSTHLQENT